MKEPLDGNIYPLLNELIEIGIDVLNPVQVSAKDIGDTHFILGRLGDGVLPIMKYTLEFLLAGMIERPEVIRRIIEVETRYCIKVSEALLDAGCDGVLPTSDLGGATTDPSCRRGCFANSSFPG